MTSTRGVKALNGEEAILSCSGVLIFGLFCAEYIAQKKKGKKKKAENFIAPLCRFDLKEQKKKKPHAANTCALKNQSDILIKHTLHLLFNIIFFID